MKTVQEILIQCVPRFTGLAENGDYILSDENGEVVITPADYWEQHPAGNDEEFFALVHTSIDDIKGMSITASTKMVDVLLDLRSSFIRYKEQQTVLTKVLMDIAISPVGGSVEMGECDECAEPYVLGADDHCGECGSCHTHCKC